MPVIYLPGKMSLMGTDRNRDEGEAQQRRWIEGAERRGRVTGTGRELRLKVKGVHSHGERTETIAFHKLT